MKHPVILTILAVMFAAMAISGCTSPTPTAAPTATTTATPAPAPAAAPTALAVTGKVNTPLNLSVSDLNGYTQHYARWQNNAGNASYSGTGPTVLDLLNKSGLQSGAASVTFACTNPANSFSSTVTLADLNSKYSDSIIAYNWSGVNRQSTTLTNTNNTLQLIVPSGGGKNQVSDIDTITVT